MIETVAIAGLVIAVLGLTQATQAATFAAQGAGGLQGAGAEDQHTGTQTE